MAILNLQDFSFTCMNLKPLNVCMSYQTTLNIVEKISEDHDVEVQFWGDNLIKNPPEKVTKSMSAQETFLMLYIHAGKFVVSLP